MDELRKKRYPNVYLKLLLVKTGPVIPRMEGNMEIWMKGSKLRIRDMTGRYVHDILGDFTHERGLGKPPADLEEMMDISSRINNDTGSSEINFYIDVNTMKAIIREPGTEEWDSDGAELLVLAEVLLSKNLGENMQTIDSCSLLKRDCRSCKFEINGVKDGATYRTIVNVVVSQNYVLRYEAKDSLVSNYTFMWEVVELQEGNVGEVDVKP